MAAINEGNSQPFWFENEKGVTSLNNYRFKKWLESESFFKSKPAGKKMFNLIKQEGIFLQLVEDFEIKDFVLDYIENTLRNEKAYNLMSGKASVFKNDFLGMLETKEIVVLKDTKDTSYLFYQNGVVETTKNKSKLKTYKSYGLHIWKDQVIKRNYVKADHHESEYRTFIWKISGGFDFPENPTIDETARYESSVERYNTFQTVIGYVLHSYNARGKNKAIVFNDEVISDDPNGQSGKGLFWNAISHLKKVQSINGKKIDLNSEFSFQSVKTDCQVLVFDDVRKSFDMEDLFSTITEGIEITYKGVDTIKLAIEDSPKILITTNYALRGIGGSHEARRFEVELSSFFNSDYTPIDLFGHYLFEDWDDNEWARFDCYMIECLKKYLTTGLLKYKSISLPYKKLEVEISKELFAFIKETKPNEWVLVSDFYTNYVANVSNKNFAKTKTFVTQSVKKYCEFFGLKREETTQGGVVKFMLVQNGLNSIQEQESSYLPF